MMSWGGKNSDVDWKIEWDGALTSGSQIYLYGNGVGSYFASNHGEGMGFSWGGKSSAYSWELQWNSGCAFN